MEGGLTLPKLHTIVLNLKITNYNNKFLESPNEMNSVRVKILTSYMRGSRDYAVCKRSPYPFSFFVC